MQLDKTVYLDEDGNPYDPEVTGLKSGRQLAAGEEVPDDFFSARAEHPKHNRARKPGKNRSK